MQAGALGVTGSPAANALANDADVVIAVGTRLQDFMTGSHSLFAQAKLVSVNVNGFDALKWRGAAVCADAGMGLDALSDALAGWQSEAAWQDKAKSLANDWRAAIARITEAHDAKPYEGDVIGAVQRSAPDSTTRDIVVCAAGTLPAELHKLWRTSTPGGYHMEYGYSCMGYEVAGAMGIALAAPEKEVVCFVGDGSYMMANSEIATAVMRRVSFTVVLTDNRGYGCINRLQIECGGAEFNNMYKDCNIEDQPQIDFVAHAASMGAHAEKVSSIAALEGAVVAARERNIPSVILIDTDPVPGMGAGGHWWDVAVPQAGGPERLVEARAKYDQNAVNQRTFD